MFLNVKKINKILAKSPIKPEQTIFPYPCGLFREGHFMIYCFGLALLAVSLPLSVFFMSLSQFIIGGNWLLEGQFRKKFRILIKRKSILLIFSILLVHFLGLIYTKDFNYAFNDIRIKLPLLILPLIIGTSHRLSIRQFKIILLFFIASVTVGSLISTSVLLGFTNHTINDNREISLFISHIRFSLLINIAIFLSGHFLFSPEYNKTLTNKIIFTFIIIWLTAFLFLLQAFTGIVILLITSFILGIYLVIKQPRVLPEKIGTGGIRLKLFYIAVLVAIPLLVLSYITKSVTKFYSVEEVDFESLEKYTKKGNVYTHNIENKQIENGNYIWLYVSEEELREEWNKISTLKYDGKDKKQQDIKYTLIRFLTSKGYRKDAEGVGMLISEDINLIENGIAAHIYKSKYSIYPRIYQIIWEIDVYVKGGNPSGHSVTQRLEYLKIAMDIIKDNFFIGVGTGDLQMVFDEYYEKLNSQLTEKWRLRAHNQFVSFFVAFGFIGFLWIIFAMLYPVYIERKFKDYFFMMFLIIAVLSMFNEDTLETQAGVTFFMFFYTLFLLQNTKH